jgi:hypothetical protein
MRKRYFARSEPGTDDHPSAYALRAAATARPTSAGVPWPTAASASSSRGAIVSYVSAGSSHSPSTKYP